MNRKLLLLLGFVLGVAVAAAGIWFGAPKLKALLKNREDSEGRADCESLTSTRRCTTSQRTSYLHWIEPSGGEWWRARAVRHGVNASRPATAGCSSSGRTRRRMALTCVPLHYSVPLDAAQFDHDARRILGGPVESQVVSRRGRASPIAR